MWVLSSNGSTLINLDRYSRLIISDKGDGVLVSAATDTGDKPVTICKCSTMAGAKDTLLEIQEYLGRGAPVYYAPENYIDRPMPKIEDARVRRRGGS